MAILSDKDLFDFDGYFKRIAELMTGLEGVTEGWAQSTVTSVTRIRAAFDAAQKELIPLKEGLKGLSVTREGADRQITDYIQKISQVGQRVSQARQSLVVLNEAQQLNGQVVTDLTAKLAALHQKYQSLDSSQKDYQKQQRAILGEVKTVTRAIDAQSKSLQVGKTVIDAAEGSLAHLKKQTTDLKKTLDSLPGAYDKTTGKLNEQNRAAVALNDQYQKNITLLNKVEQGQKVFGRNVGNYPQGGSQAGNISSIGGKALGALASVGIVDRVLGKVVDSIKAVGDITLQFDSLDSALKVVSEDTALFTQRQAMLQRVSDALGQDLSVVEKTYTNLTASSKDTRLEGAATDDIFEKVVGTMGRLKKSGAETEGALLAIGQMMSKGTVQSEELRGQLGERIPGAFNIMARALGVTTTQLGVMLKQGKVLAEDALPLFAAELERTFNPNHERRVEGLAANLARLRNEGVEWVKSINIGDKAGEFIGNITGMARSVREFFAPAVQTSAMRLAEQAEAVSHLESQLPALLSRYDELKSKSKLSTDEQKELQTVINSLVNLAPSAATGFDAYGNALDVNKGKVMSFTRAQRDLNAELNKQAIAALKDQTSGGLDRIDKAQNTLNRGTKQKSFNLVPYFLRSNEEKQNTVGSDNGRTTALSDNDRRKLQADLQTQNKQVELSIIQRLQLGDKLDAATIWHIEHGGSAALKQYKIVSDFNDKIADLTTKQADLLLKGDKVSLKEREGVLKELKAFEDKKRAILSPTLPGDKVAVDKPGSTKAEQSAAEKRLRDALALTKAAQEKNLALLNSDRQEGLIDEQTFIEKQLQTTLNGLNKRQALLEKANQKETKEYQDVLEERAKAEANYNRSQLQLDLKTNKGKTDKSLSGLDRQRGESDMDEFTYNERRHELVVAGIERERTILKEAGQQKTELFKATDTALEEEQTDYLSKRLITEKKGWKDVLEATKEGLRAIDQLAAADYEARLAEDHAYYNNLRNQVELAQAQGKLSPREASRQLHLIDSDEIKAELYIFKDSVGQSKVLTHELIQDRIDQLTSYIRHSEASETELAGAKKQIAALEKLQNQSDAADTIKTQNQVAENGIKQSDKEYKHKKELADEERERRNTALEIVTKPIDGAFQIEGFQDSAKAIMSVYDMIHNHKERLAQLEKMTDAERNKAKLDDLQDYAVAAMSIADSLVGTLFSIEQQKTANELSELDRRKEHELELAGDNADAKATIEKKYDAERKRLQHQQDIQARERAVFQILLATAVGVVKALPDLPLAIIVGALGAIELVATLAAHLPAYKHGKRSTDTYTGLALGGEAGAELLVDRQGASQLLTGPTIFHTKPGDRVYTATETSALLGSWHQQQIADITQQEISLNNQSADRFRQGRLNEQVIIRQLANQNRPSLTEAQVKRAFAEALDSRPENVTIHDELGVRRGQRRGNSVHEYLEKRNRW